MPFRLRQHEMQTRFKREGKGKGCFSSLGPSVSLPTPPPPTHTLYKYSIDTFILPMTNIYTIHHKTDTHSDLTYHIDHTHHTDVKQAHAKQAHKYLT